MEINKACCFVQFLSAVIVEFRLQMKGEQAQTVCFLLNGGQYLFPNTPIAVVRCYIKFVYESIAPAKFKCESVGKCYITNRLIINVNKPN